MSAAPQIDWAKIPGAKVVAASASPAPVDWSKIPGARVVPPAPTATVSAAPAAGLLHPEQWLDNVANDLRYGGTSTWVGRAARAVGAQPLYSGVSHDAAEFMGGPELGIPKAVKGALETVSGHLLKGPSDVISGAAQAAAPIAGATEPEFLPGAAKAIGTATAIGGAARAVGASPETASELGNVGSAAGLEAERRLAGATVPEAVAKPVETTANAASAGATAVGSAATAARDSKAANMIIGPRAQGVEPVDGVVRAIRARNSVKDFPAQVAMALPEVRGALADIGIDPQAMTPRNFEDAIAKAKTNVWTRLVSNFLGPNANVELPTDSVAHSIAGVAQRMTPIAANENPRLLEAIGQSANQYAGQRMSMGTIESRIQELNNELRSAQATFKVNRDALKSNPQYGYRFAELESLRQLQADALQRLAGPGAGALKRTYGALKVLQDATDRRIPVIERGANAKVYEGAGALFGAANMVGGVLRGNPGEFARGAAEFKIGRNIQKMNDPEFLLRAAMQNTPVPDRPYATGVPPAPTPPDNRGLALPETTAAGRPIPRRLGGATVGQRALPPVTEPIPQPGRVGPQRLLEQTAGPEGAGVPPPPAPPPRPLRVGNANQVPPKAFLGGGVVRDPVTGRMARVQTQEVPLAQSPLVAPNPVPEGVTVKIGKGYKIVRDPKTGRMMKVKQ